ncbi:antibiotic biosynthesis monooxygenase [Sandaracinus amylolyticus]|uniref:antibiotic biosynthesis monooxygenase n=1 Tax=Sandaracinus amylolyticus TaxID=927083 RepID=UPI001F38BA76|nr:antibiotic biosynthesis monooxygenase [Sandaracinus amylolyticus]UJR78946.1 ABM domain-containing protein [Sandaracinus amylolyticus]
MHRRTSAILILAAILLFPACDTGSPADASSADDAGACSPGVLEADLESAFGLVGPGVDPETGALAPPGPEGYIVSSTYGQAQPTPAAQARFGELIGDIVPELMNNPGVVAFELRSSASCGSGRTLAIWRDAASMYAFVASTPHTTAMAEADQVTMPGFRTTHWMAHDLAETSWSAAAEHVAADAD